MLEALGGLALFLFGLSQASQHLGALAGPALSRILRSARGAPVVGVLAGAIVTAVAQSGTAVGAMAGSFVGAGLFGVREGLAVTLGAAVGGTIALQLVSLKIVVVALPLVGVGYLASRLRSTTARAIGGAAIGLGLVFLGLDVLVSGLRPVAADPLVRQVLAALSGAPVALAVFGMMLAAVAHSSNAPAALAVALAASGALAPTAALALVVGANAGSALNLVLASAGKDVGARRVAGGYLGLKVAGATVALALLGPAAAGLARLADDPARLVANGHTLFNLLVAVAAMPLLGPVERLAQRAIPDPPERGPRPKYLSQDALGNPALAYSLAFREVARVADHVLLMVGAALEAIRRDRSAAERVRQEEETVDALSHEVVVYLARLGNTLPDGRVQALLGITSSLEAIGDLVKRLLRQDQKLVGRGLALSPEGRREVGEVADATLERARLVLNALAVGDARGCEAAAADRSIVRSAIARSRAAHLDRLRAGRSETQLTSAVHLDTLTILEQVNSEVSAIAERAALVEARVA